MNLNAVPDEAFSSGLLHKEYHERLILDLEKLALLAGVPTHVVWSRMSDFCNEAEVAWVRSVRSTQDAGLVFVGKGHSPSVADKMLAVTGVALRNYTDARVMPVQDVLRLLKADDMPTCTMLLIPNFCMEKDSGGDIASWEVSSLMGLLLSRSNLGLKTLLYVTNMATLEKQYGATMREHIEDKFSVSKPNEFKHSKQTA